MIFSTSRRWRGAETSSRVTWYRGHFLGKLLRTYCVNPAGWYLGRSLLSYGLPPLRQQQQQPTAAASTSLVLWLSSSWFACRWCDTCSSSASCCYYSYDMVPRVKNYMPHSSAVVVLTRVYVASPRHITLSAACGSFDYRRLPPSSGVAPCTLLLVRAASGGPDLLVAPASSKAKRHVPTYHLMTPPAPFWLAIQASGKYTFIK